MKTDLPGPFISRNDALLLESLVARWYGRLLLGCANPLAAIQSVEHALRAVDSWCTWPPIDGIEKRAPAEPGEITRLKLTIDHTHLIFRVARVLWRNRLSDQFASRALLGLQRTADKTIEALMRAGEDGALSEDHGNALSQAAEILKSDINRFRRSLQLEEGDFRKALEAACEAVKAFQDVQNWPKSEPDPEAKAKAWCYAKLETATAHLCLRHYEDAELHLGELWQWMWKPGEAPAVGEGRPTAQARAWLYPSDGRKSALDWERRMLGRIARSYPALVRRPLSDVVFWPFSGASDKKGADP